MDTERDLLFGVVAFQSGAVDADELAETCAAWADEPTKPLADLFVNRGLITDEQRTEVEKLVVRELQSHGGDPRASLEATLDGRSLDAIRDFGGLDGSLHAKLKLPSLPKADHVVIAELSPSETESKERYSLTHLHAKGGMGRVWLARDTSLGRQIALKELRPDQAENSIVCSRFLYEAKITAQLEHPGIVPVYEVGEGEVPYYTMRFVQGRTLSEAIRSYHKQRAAGEAGPVALVKLLGAFVGVCHAVAYAHSRGVLHRDLKGQNVVLGEFGEVMVLDWGLAKRVRPDPHADAGEEISESPLDLAAAATARNPGGEHTLASPPDPSGGSVSEAASSPSSNGVSSHATGLISRLGQPSRVESGAGPEGTMQGQLLGTPGFMAPEQARGCHDLVDERTDVYGLGAILYEILTGRPPFVGPKTSEIVHKVWHEAPAPPRQLVANMPARFAGLQAICLKALEKLPARRYASASELAHEVERWLADEPVRAFPEPWVSRVLRWGRRHKTAVSATAALLLTATIALAISTILIAREAREAQVQGEQARHAVGLLTKGPEIGFDDGVDPIQKEFLENALAYYEQFTSRAASNPAVKLEHGRAYQQMGDIERKLGRLGDSEAAYRQAAGILEPLVKDVRGGQEAKQLLARTLTLLGDLLVRRGGDKGQAGSLYSRALELEQALLGLPTATASDSLNLGQTFKSQADLLRLDGHFRQAKTVYDKAIASLERARAANGKSNEIRHDVALAADARGLVYLEIGDVSAGGQDFKRALKLLDGLVAEFPTVSRYRESLAKVCNSLGLLEKDSGHLAEAEDLIRRELPLVERLAQDYPDRPEHRRELARALYNLGVILMAENRTAGAEPLLHRAVEVASAIAAKFSDDIQIRFDLAKCHHNLGELLLEKGDSQAAVASFSQERSINDSLVKAFPDKPRYRHLLAVNLVSLAFALQPNDPAKAESVYNTALEIYEKLVAAFPDNVEYRIGQARCLRNVGPILAAADRPQQALAAYQKALTSLATKDAAAQTPERLLNQAQVLNNLADLERKLGQSKAEETLRRTVAIFHDLASRPKPTREVRHNLAIAQYNLGDLLIERKRFQEAEVSLDQAVAGFDALVAEAPSSIDLQSESGLILTAKGDLLAKRGEHALAKIALANAVSHQRAAVKLSKNRSDTRALLGQHLIALADINTKLGAYKEAATNALEVPNAVPASLRAQGCLDAARSLARLVAHAANDPELPADKREQVARNYLARTVVLLREVIDTKESLIEEIRKDPDIKGLESRPEFQTLMSTLVHVTK
jgi:serine/threonine protein kinase